LIFQFNYYEIVNGKKRFKPLKYSTGEKIPKKYWNPSTCRARNTDDYPQHKELNARLGSLASIIEDEYRRVLNDRLKATPDLLRERLKVRLGLSVPKVEKVSLFDFIDQMIEECKSGKRLTENGKKFSNSTIKVYKTTKTRLEDFQKEYRGVINFDSIDMDFYNDFLAYFNKHEYAINSIGKYIKNLKVFMRAAADQKLHSNFEFQNKKFKTIEETTDSIYLSEAEIELIYNYDFSYDPSREKVRDLFVIGCYTGLRFSDYDKIVPENIKKIDKGSFLQVNTQKTTEKVAIPLNWIVLGILKKYDGRVPKPFTNQEMNRELKKIGKKVKIKEKVSTGITRGGIRKDSFVEKWELITTHTARRSAATNMYIAGIPTISIMKITGHRTEKAFLRYIKISQEDNALKLMDHPYFSQEKPIKENDKEKHIEEVQE